MKHNHIAIVALLGAVAAFAAGDAVATQRAYPAMGGQGWPRTGAYKATECFESGWAEVTNVCGSQKTFLLPLDIYTPNAVAPEMFYYFTAYGKLGPGQQTKCKVVENDGSNSGWFTNSAWTIGPSPFYQTRSMGSIVVEETHTVHLDCQIDPNAKLVSVLTN